ncbi:MAG: oligopeptidase A [Candidatus Azotimanducaceae bacterium]|jgi:oligopeptidase A
MNNPLLETHELPPFSTIKAEHVMPAIDTILAENRSAIAALLEQSSYSWDSLIRPLEELGDRLAQAFSPVSHMNSVVNTTEMRDAYNEALPRLSEYQTEMGQNPKLFKAYETIRNAPEYETLDQPQKKTILNALRDFKLSGIDLPTADKKRFADISSRLSSLSSQFSDNVLDATMAWQKHIEDAALLKGLPDSALDQARQLAEQSEKTGYLFTLDFPSYFPIVTYADDAELRREFYEAFTTRASDQGPNKGQWDNSTIIEEILSLRKEMAGLLGFENYAEVSLAPKMAKDTDQVLNFLRELAAKSKPAAEEEFAEICQFALEQYEASEVNAWDVSYFAEKLKEHKFSISQETLKTYFPAPRVIEGMFEVVRRLYDIEIKEVCDIETWHTDVHTYNVQKNGELIARFYLDLYARQNKQGGAWMDDCRARRLKSTGEIQLPVAYLTCNFSGPVGDKPALLTHNEVVTLFHEFGHGLHHMMTKVACASVSGINGVAWDAVELPSQFMENWCWEPEALQFISGHFETGECLPADLLDKMMSAKTFMAGMMYARQLEFSLFDFRLHVEFVPDRAGQAQEILNEVRAEVAVIAAPDSNRFQNGFSHIFGGGYAAGYYSYKWAEVLSADAFARFKEDGIFNRQTGEKFLATVLEQGGSVDAMDLFVQFRGREPEIEALLKQDGIL